MHIAIVLLQYNPYGGYERQAAILTEELVARGETVTVFANKWIGTHQKMVVFRKVPVIKVSSWLKVLSFAIFSRHIINKSKADIDVIIAYDRTLLMDIYRAGNACHKEWLNVRRRYGTLRDRISIAINPLHVVINIIEKHIFSQIQQKKGQVIILSPSGAKQIMKYYPIDEKRFTVIPPALDLKRFIGDVSDSGRRGTREMLGISNDSLLLLHVGSGFRIKGLSSTIEAISILHKKGIMAELIVVGDDRKGTLWAKRLCRKLGLEGSVHFTGGVPDVERYYWASDIFVLPSLFETFGISAIEALACWLPVIIGRGAGVSDIITKESVGKVVDVPSDPARLSVTIERIAISEKKLMTPKARAEARSDRVETASACSPTIIMSELLTFINLIAKEKSAGG